MNSGKKRKAVQGFGVNGINKGLFQVENELPCGCTALHVQR